jgi:hypothetical protein
VIFRPMMGRPSDMTHSCHSTDIYSSYFRDITLGDLCKSLPSLPLAFQRNATILDGMVMVKEP